MFPLTVCSLRGRDVINVAIRVEWIRLDSDNRLFLPRKIYFRIQKFFRVNQFIPWDRVLDLAYDVSKVLPTKTFAVTSDRFHL